MIGTPVGSREPLESLNDRLSRLTPAQRARLLTAVRDKAARDRAAQDGVAQNPTRRMSAGPIPRLDRSSGRLPMSYAQRRHYFLQRLHPESPAYNNLEAVRLRGGLDLDALRVALSTVVARHEVLRTRCSPGEGEAAAELVVTDPAATDPHLAIEVVETGSLDEAREVFARRAERPFDLDSDFPIRVTLARIGPDDHALLFVLHHIASDAWSCRLLLSEFFQAYAVAAAGGGSEPDPLAIQYADFAAWQHTELGTERVASHLNYWRERLAGMPRVLELPLEHPRPPVRGDHGAEIHLELDLQTRTRLHATARSASVTPFVLLLTAFGYVLHRHCATEDVVVGAPVAGRDRVEWERLVGCFVNTVVLRLDFSDLPTRRDLVRRVWQHTLGDFEHQELPFEHLVAELAPDRDLSVGQLVQVMFNHYPATDVREQVPRLDIQPLDVARARAKFDLTCTVVDSRHGMRVTLNYATELLDRDLAVRLTEHFVAVLDALLTDLDAPAATLPMVPPSDPAPALESGHAAPVSVLSRFEANARRYPDRTAVRYLADRVNYRELNARANRLARYLVDRTDGSGPVGLLFERSVEYVVAMLAAIKAGLTYLPLDPTMPAGHVAAVCQEAGVRLLLSHGEVDWTHVDRGPSNVEPSDPGPAHAGSIEIVATDRIATELARYPDENLDRHVDPAQPMYLLFTSGSTGRPKGVVVEHRHFTRYLSSVLHRMDIPEGLNYAMVSSFAADLGLTNLYGALATGGTLHVLPYESATDPAQLAGYFREHRIDFMKLVPSHLAAIAEAGLLDAVVPDRHLVLAGEACPWGLVDAVRAVRPQCTVWNQYGPTETTVSVLAYRVPDEPPSPRGGTVPLGYPLDHVRVHVVDRQLRPVPRGAAGELLITGGSVARGYLSGGALSGDAGADRFIPNPFSGDPAARAYRSGDRVRLRADGSVEFLGRIDRQAKIRGYRVEPGYVEAVLRRHEAVADAAVAVRQDQAGRATLVAYLVTEPAAVPAVREFARSAMPPYLVPAGYVPMDRLPLTPNGKIDWRALPDPDPQLSRQQPATPPRNTRDAAVVEIWCQVLGLDGIGIDDHFFEVGGDSFAAMRVARRMGDGVRVVSLFQHPTIRQLVDFLDSHGDGETSGYLYRLPGRAAGTRTRTGTTTASVVAVPFGGGTAAGYQDLASALPPEFPLYAVELPGHDVANPHQPLESFDTIAAGTVAEIRRTVSGPVVVYGHCVGAALAFEIANRLRAEGGQVVGVVLGGAFPAPRLPGKLFEWWARVMPSDRWRSDRLYRDMLRSIGGLTDVLDKAEQSLSLRALRHDSRESEDLYSRLCHDPEHRRTIHALCVVGERDRITEFHQERYREWNLLCADTELDVIPEAGHYFLKHQPDRLAEAIVGWTRRRLAVAAAGPPDSTRRSDPARVPDPEQGPTGTPARNLRGFALVTLGQLVSQVGSRALAFALGIWVYLETGSVTQFSVILVTALLPGLLALPFAGAAADRWNRRSLMIAAEVVNATGTGLILLTYATGSLQIWHIYVAASLGSIATSFQQPAYLAAVAQLVPKQYLSRANGAQQAVLAVSQAAGPLLGGALIVAIGLGGVMLVDISTVVVAVFTLVAVRFPNLLFRKREESIWKEIRGGVRYIARRRNLVAMIVFFLGYNLVLGFALALLPPMVLAFASTATLSLAAMVGAVGGIVGGVAMALWGGFERRATGMVGFVALTGAGMIVAGLWPSPLLPILGLAGIMASIALINGHWQTMIQVKVGMELQGRVLATNRMTANLTEPLGYVGAGWLADMWFEPAMAPGGWLSHQLGGLVGSGPGRGMAVLLMLLGGVQVALAVAGLRWHSLRYMEDALPDAVPGAIVTWDRDRLQREADLMLARRA